MVQRPLITRIRAFFVTTARKPARAAERRTGMRHDGALTAQHDPLSMAHTQPQGPMKMTAMPPRFPITPEQIDLVMSRFYTKVRQDETLGPIFDGHIDDWPEHEAKIAGFWRNAILFEGGYSGSPMQAHMRAGDVRADHFDNWLALFDDVLETSLPAQTAAAWSALVHRIGRGLRMGVQDVGRPAGTVPTLK